MIKKIDLRLAPSIAFDDSTLREYLLKESYFNEKQEVNIKKIKRSIDARAKVVVVNLSLEIYINEPIQTTLSYKIPKNIVEKKQRVVIVGAGPAGLFAALKCIELGYKPILIERGKDVRQRRRDLAAINKDQIVNPESNYCFGEGGAGTYSDGKLYTRSTKRGDVRRILEILVAHGAKEDILIDAHPHIGTNKLPALIANMRETILALGGEILFETKVIDLVIESQEIKGVITEGGQEILGLGVVLATGHSARDIFELLYKKKIYIENKPFALGVRVEHPQSLIDSIQYHCETRDYLLPASSYSLVSQANYQGKDRGVFSFCMCPGGFIVPSATAPGEIVVNGMSPSKRDSKFANSGIVVSVEEDEIPEYQQYGPLAGLKFQQDIEQLACKMAGNKQVAPAQRLVDFTQNIQSTNLNETSYQPGLSSLNMSDILPSFIGERLKIGFKSFGTKMRGYYTNEAQIIGIESRTSSPVRIPRDKESLEHVQIKRLFPCGEGAGYAGGIVSAAMDGENCVEKLIAIHGKSN